MNRLMTIAPFRWLTVAALAAVVWLAGRPAMADQATTLEDVTVTATKQAPVTGPFLPDVRGTRIYAGKKTTNTVLSELPPIHSNTYRQAFHEMPGLLVSEAPGRGNVNFNYRGIGDPHEAQDLLILKDGIPLVVERFGYSTAYYIPPLESVERVELIRGGGALLYGPQPGPVLNYVTYQPPTDRPITASTQHQVGSYGTYSTDNQVGGTVDRVGYLASQYHSDSNGQRANEGFDMDGGGLRMVSDPAPGSRWTLNVDAHRHESHEPGRLTLAQFQTNRDQTLRPHDRLEFTRYAASLVHDRELSEQTLATLALYGSSVDRFSLRRTSNTSTQNNLDRREVSSGAVEGRLRHEYDAFGNPQTFTVGSLFYYADAPRTQDRSVAGRYPSELGNPIFDFDYRTVYGALFGEHRFGFGRLAVIPGFRLELMNARVKENFNTGKTSALHDIDESYVVPLFGLGLQYDLGGQTQAYANASQAYKPPQFDDLAPTGNNTLPATDLDEGKAWNYEVGVRGTPVPWFQYDASAFLTDYDSYFGTVTVGSSTRRQNVGRAIYHGAEIGGAVDLVQLHAMAKGNREPPRIGSLNVIGGVSLLSAEFDSGPLNGLEPAYAPNVQARLGLVYDWFERVKLAFLGTMVEDHYWADNNQAGTTGTTGIPAYTVWDLTGELNLIKDRVKLFAGINNVFDENYFSRVRSDGIEPAQRRNYYAGAKVKF